MEEIKKKMFELLSLNEKTTHGFPELFEHMKVQETLGNELEELAKKNNTILGRTIRFPVADGHALYIIYKIGKKYVDLEWIDYCDGYYDDVISNYGNRIPLAYAEELVRRNDALAEIFGQKQKETK